MKTELLSKLQIELNKEIKTEPQVVYILSRVRKILELDKNQNNYKKLKFYCDWALHAEIDKATKTFQTELKNFVEGDLAAGDKVITFQHFHEDFLAFLDAYKISPTNYLHADNKFEFWKLLAQIYSDTPLIVTVSKRYKITTNEGVHERKGSNSIIEIGFRIESLEE